MKRCAPFLLALALGCTAGAEAQQSRIAEIQIAPRYLRMRVDAVAPLVATAYDADGIPVHAQFQWASSNINVADVGDDGLVHGVAPGATVVTAAVGIGAARRVGQVSVYVMRAGQVVVTPVPPTPGVAPVQPPPGVWVGPPPPKVRAPQTPGVRMNVDSLVRASIDCDEPFVNAINPAHACWDERARLRDPSRLTLGVSAGACPGITRTTVGVLVLVGEGGEVQEVRAYAPTGCPAIDAAAEQAARALAFAPALREGRPHRSWVRLQIRTEP